MPIGTSDGEFYDDQFAMHVADFATSPANPEPVIHSGIALNPQEQFLYNMHLSNLNGPGGVDNPDGSRSSLYQSVQEKDGKYYNVPTVWNGKIETEKYTDEAGKVWDVPNDTALKNISDIGWDKFPSYDTPEQADKRYEEMHKYMEQDTRKYLDQKAISEAPPDWKNMSLDELFNRLSSDK